MYIDMFAYLGVYVHVYENTQAYAYAHVYAHVYVCAYVCVHIGCVCAHVYVSMLGMRLKFGLTDQGPPQDSLGSLRRRL